MGFGRRAQVLTDTLGMSPPFTEIIREDIHVIKIGLNYRFNWGLLLIAARVEQFHSRHRQPASLQGA